VAAAPEPPDFDEKVRQRGLKAIAAMVGEAPARRARGRPFRKVADRREDIPSTEFPDFWCDALPQMRQLYDGICAYMGMRVYPGLSGGTVDHYIPKTASWENVYEWSNYRFACAEVNRWKGTKILPYDPFTMPDELCALELVAFQVKPGNAATGDAEALVDHMINQQLRLNERLCREARERYFTDYITGGIKLYVLERDAPFIAMELRRQGMLLPGDV
jgi:hypothetical protein